MHATTTQSKLRAVHAVQTCASLLPTGQHEQKAVLTVCLCPGTLLTLRGRAAHRQLGLRSTCQLWAGSVLRISPLQLVQTPEKQLPSHLISTSLPIPSLLPLGCTTEAGQSAAVSKQAGDMGLDPSLWGEWKKRENRVVTLFWGIIRQQVLRGWLFLAVCTAWSRATTYSCCQYLQLLSQWCRASHVGESCSEVAHNTRQDACATKRWQRLADSHWTFFKLDDEKMN